ncbi:MAG: serine/threonine-protein kinase PknK, partial [Deltaproteobacteria bacterium]|nr:serine/threonine-protein kinase PknK [Deltaproteobacteria bacterium]
MNAKNSSFDPKTPPWRLERLLGVGGMGKVFLAKAGKDSAALKFLSQTGLISSKESFKEEVRVLARLRHPRLVGVLDYFDAEKTRDILAASSQELTSQIPQGSPCFAMEYLAGQPLSEAPISVSQASGLFFQALEGLQFLHRFNLLHCDLKPSNLFLTPKGEIKILDFGLTQALRERETGENLGGTTFFQAPETFLGRYDFRSDLFSLGVTFFRLLAGRFPYERPLFPNNLAKAAPPPDLRTLVPEIPEYLSEALHRCIQISPDQRPASAALLLKYLNQHDPSQLLPPELDQAAPEEHFPFVERDMEIRRLNEALLTCEREQRPHLLLLRGPTGVGRSRLLEEFRWKVLLSDRDFRFFSPANPAANIEGFGSRDKTSAVAFVDCHLGKPDYLRQLQGLLSSIETRPLFLILEANDEVFDTELFARWAEDSGWPFHRVELAGLEKEAFERLVEKTTPGNPLSAAEK